MELLDIASLFIETETTGLTGAVGEKIDVLLHAGPEKYLSDRKSALAADGSAFPGHADYC